MKIFTKHSVIGFILGGIIVPVIFMLTFDIYVETENEESAVNNYPPPEFNIEKTVDYEWNIHTLDGEKKRASEYFDNKIVFLNFWATWCGPCVGEMPSIQKLYDKFGNRIAFACVSNEKLSEISEFIESKGFTFPVYKIDVAPAEFDIKGIPATFIISKDKIIKFKHIGGADWSHDKVIEYLENMLKEN
jgi:thiol-disulfide isomerase/thioredoxin